MGEEGRSARRQPSSTRHSSMQRVRPRARASNQSLQSAGRPQETTFTSFEPFSPPKISRSNGEGASNEQIASNRLSDSASVKSYSSSKRSRSIYAPHRQNSVAEQASDVAHSSYGDGDEQTYSSGVSVASRSLHAVLMDQPEQSRPALFPDNMNAYRSNPQSLADLSPNELSLFIYREGGADNVVRRLAKDLAEKDAEVAMLRRKSDKYAFLFKEHLTTVHQMSRLEADKKVQSHFPNPSENTRTYSEEVQAAMAEAIEDPFGDQFSISSVDPTAAGATEVTRSVSPLSRSKSTRSEHGELTTRQQNSLRRRIVANATANASTNANQGVTASAKSPNTSAFVAKPSSTAMVLQNGSNASTNNRRTSGLWGMFGGTSRTVKETTNKRNSIATLIGMPTPNLKSQSLRSPSLSEPPTKAPPLEMEQKIDEAELPPPLLNMRQLLILYHDSTFDNYGFVIDKARVVSFVQYWTTKNSLPIQAYKKILSLPAKPVQTRSRPTSIISVESNHDADLSDSLDTLLDPADSPVENVELPSKSWFDYLAFGGTLGLISRMPTQPQASSGRHRTTSAYDSDDEDPAELDARNCEMIVDSDDYLDLATKLRDEITKEYTLLQQDRSRAWTRLLNTMAGGSSANNNRITRLLVNTNGTSTSGHTRDRSNSFSTSSVGIANLASSQYQDQFIKFVLGGIPMHLRCKIWLENADSSIHYSPEAFEGYVAEYSRSLGPQHDTSQDINADKTRTLTNNIWFRRNMFSSSSVPSNENRTSSSQENLAKILRAFAVRNPHIGYIQGFNLIAGYLMLAMPTTEQSFWVFCFLIETVLPPSYFSADEYTFTGPRADTVVLRGFIRQLMPKLAAHMDSLDLPDDQTVPINWLLTAFASTLSVEALFRVWDVVLAVPAQGTYLLRVALALLKINEEKLLRANSASQLYQILDRHMGAGVSIDGLVHASWVLGRTVTAGVVAKRREAALKEV